MINLLKPIEFKLKKFIYSIQDRLIKLKSNQSISKYFWFLTLPQILKSVVFISVLFFIEILCRNYSNENWNYLPDLIQNIFKHIPDITNSDKYLEKTLPFISILASINGLILALFFPIVTTILSSAFTKVPSDVRFILLKEPSTQNFINNITFTLSLTLLIMFFMIFNYMPGALIIGTVTLFSLRGFYYLIKIGFGIFKYFDPSNLTKNIIQEMIKNLKYATNKGRFYDDKNFQHHYYSNTLKNIEQLRFLVGMITQEKFLQAGSFELTVRSIIGFLNYYQTTKLNIPIKSLWFQKTAKHKSHFKANDTSRRFASEFDSFLQPEHVLDYNWVEKAMLSIIFDGINELEKNDSIETIVQIFILFNDFSEQNGLFFNKTIENLLIKKSSSLIIKLTSEKFSNQESLLIEFESKVAYFSIVELYFKLFQSFEFGVFKKTEKLNKNKLIKFINDLYPTFNKTNTIKVDDLVPSIKKSLLNVHELIKTERYIENKTLTPQWYIIQYVTNNYIHEYEKMLLFFEELYDIYNQVLNHFKQNNNILFEVFSQLLALANLSMQSKHLGHSFAIIKEAETLKINKEITRLPIEFKKFTSQFLGIRKNYIKDISKNLFSLSLISKSDKIPDIFGQSYSIISKEISMALNTCDFEYFSTLYSSLLPTSLIFTENLFNEAQELSYTDVWQIKYSNQTIFNLLEISGLAYIYSELYEDKRFVNHVYSEWDKYFNKMENINSGYEKNTILNIVIRYAFSQRRNYGLDQNFEMSVNRKRGLLNKLEEMNLISDYPKQYESSKKKNNKLFQNPILEIVIPQQLQSSFFHDFKEIFIELFLLCRVNAKEIEPTYQRNFLNALDFYINRNYKNEKH